MISKSAAAQSLALEGNRNMLREMDKIIEEWVKNLDDVSSKTSRTTAKTSAKKK